MSSPAVTPNASPRTTPTKNRTNPTMKLTLSSNTPPSTPPSPGSPLSPMSIGPLHRATSGPASVARSFSGESTISSISTTSSSRSSMTMTTRRRGFMRPQGTEFSVSAKQRESVMALGSIAHLQYFFAKTGLLDGKGGGLQRKKSANSLTVDTSADSRDSTYSSLRSSPELFLPGELEFYLESPLMMEDYDFDDSIMLPPTTSTYNPHTRQIPPAPDSDVLRRRLRDSLSVTKKVWLKAGEVPQEIQGFEELQELQGTELCELGTAAIRAAKTYYYTTDISLLSNKDDKTLREEFLAVLDVLKRMAQRKFAGGVKTEERDALVNWILGVEAALDDEERTIAELRCKGRDWLEGSWEGREYDRYHLFLSYFDASDEPLPPHSPMDSAPELPTPFLTSMKTGLRLIQIHNAVVRRSKHPFGQIPKYHTEFSKPYRLAENLRYWKKAAEIRFEIRLKFDVAAVVNGTTEGWRQFDRDIGIWCKRVLAEVRQDWEMGEGAAVVGQVRSSRSATMASMKVETGDSGFF